MLENVCGVEHKVQKFYYTQLAGLNEPPMPKKTYQRNFFMAKISCIHDNIAFLWHSFGLRRNCYVPLGKSMILSHAFPLIFPSHFLSFVFFHPRGNFFIRFCADSFEGKKFLLKLSSNVKFILKSMGEKNKLNFSLDEQESLKLC